VPASSTPGVGTPLVLQLATFPLFPHMTFPVCVYGDRERPRARGLVTPPLIRMSDPLGLGPHSYTSVCVVLGHSVVSDSWWPHELWHTRLLSPWEFSRQESWSGFPFPSNIKTKSLTGADFKNLCTIGSHDVVQTGSSTPLLGVNQFIYKVDKDPYFHGVRDGREWRQYAWM
jgi:hypothetical protein